MFLAFIKYDCWLIGIELKSPYGPDYPNSDGVRRDDHSQPVHLTERH